MQSGTIYIQDCQVLALGLERAEIKNVSKHSISPAAVPKILVLYLPFPIALKLQALCQLYLHKIQLAFGAVLHNLKIDY